MPKLLGPYTFADVMSVGAVKSRPVAKCPFSHGPPQVLWAFGCCPVAVVPSYAFGLLPVFAFTRPAAEYPASVPAAIFPEAVKYSISVTVCH